MVYTDSRGHETLDCSAGLWCVNAGHYRTHINEAIATQLEQLDFAHNFNSGHPLVFDYAERLTQHVPDPLNHVFFTNSGSESVDTALKIALAYQRAWRRHAATTHRARVCLSRHGLWWSQRRWLSQKSASLWTAVARHCSHQRHPRPRRQSIFERTSTGGAELANDLERLVNLHGADSIAAVIVEPLAVLAAFICPRSAISKDCERSVMSTEYC